MTGDPERAVQTWDRFGPLKPLAWNIYQLYLRGRVDLAWECWHGADLLAERMGDVKSRLVMLYYCCLLGEQSADWPTVVRYAELLLRRLAEQPRPDPFEQARAYAMLALARTQLGDLTAALRSAAQAYVLLQTGQGMTHARNTAAESLAWSLRAALLFEAAARTSRVAVTTAVLGPLWRGIALTQAAQIEHTWALYLDLSGEEAERDRHWSAAFGAARTAMACLREEDPEIHRQADAIAQIASDRLGGPPADPALLQRHIDEMGGQEALAARWHLLRGTLLALRDGDRHALAEAERRVDELIADCAVHGELVLIWSAVATRAETATRVLALPLSPWHAWRARRALHRLWQDRAGRFEQLVDYQVFAELQAQVEAGRAQAWRDPLTGVGNRRLLDRVTGPDEQGHAVVFLDVDRFKEVNDRYGHDVGDAVLQAVAAALRRAQGPDDIVARFGGDEFVVVLGEGGDLPPATARIRAALADVDWGALAPGLAVGVSLGTADAGPEALRRADEAMYAGRSLVAARTRTSTGRIPPPRSR